MKKSGVYMVESDKSVVQIEDNTAFSIHTRNVGEVKLAPINVSVLVDPVKRVRWFEFWRWYLIPGQKRRLKKSIERFKELYGEPDLVTTGYLMKSKDK